MAYLLLSALLYALNNFLWKVNLMRIDAYGLIWSRATFTFVYSCIGLFLLTEPISQLQTALYNDGWYYLLASFFGLLGLVFMIYGLDKGTLMQMSLFQAIMAVASGVIVSIIAEVIVSTAFGAVFILAAFFIHLKKGDNQQANNKGWLFFFIMMVCFLISGFINWYLVIIHPPIISILSQEFLVLLIFTIYGFFKPKKIFSHYKNNAFGISGFALVIFGAIYFGTIGLKLSNPFLVSISGLLSPILTGTLGVIVMKERWSWKFLASYILIGVGVSLVLI